MAAPAVCAAGDRHRAERACRRAAEAAHAVCAARHIRELETAASIDPDKLAEALELLKMAKLAARPRRRKRPEEVAVAEPPWDAPARTVVRSLRAAAIDTQRAPEDALMDFIASRSPPPPKRRRQRGRRFTRADYHAWMMQKVR
jgi:hypothetical protein